MNTDSDSMGGWTKIMWLSIKLSVEFYNNLIPFLLGLLVLCLKFIGEDGGAMKKLRYM